MEETQLINGDAEESSDPPEPDAPRDWSKGLLGLIVALLVGVVVLQVIQLQRSDSLTGEVSALTEDVTDLKPLRRDVDLLGDQVAAMDRQLTEAVNASGASPVATQQGVDGSLPLFEESTNDPAVITEMKLSAIKGPEYYTGANASYDPTDGKARVWMIWAHWCPYCQAELPELDAWWPANAERFPNVELVTVSSAIDDTRGDNPLVPYLDDEQFSFPVIVDEAGDVSRMFGTSAFPFWVVTDSEGTVVLRVAGALGVSSVDQIFTQLETMASEI